jgi:phosphohistidine swiveling domain-containing protein
MLVNRMRSAALALAQEQHVSDPRLVYFAHMEELALPKLNEHILYERKNEYSVQTHADLPERIASFPLNKKSSVYGVSPGVASGIVVYDRATLSADTPCILFVERLAPEIADLFPKLKGIVAHEGGVLSHLAILAREFGIPAVVDPDACRRVREGEHVAIDGGKGVVTVI